MVKEFYSVETGDWPNRIVKDAEGKEYPHALACHVPTGWILQHSYKHDVREHGVSLHTGEEYSMMEIVMAPAPLTVTMIEE